VQFSPFVGIAPSLYGALFSLGSRERKDSQGGIKKWTRGDAFPQLLKAYLERASRAAEKEILEFFSRQLEEKGLVHGSN
jgi:hypothetical protein